MTFVAYTSAFIIQDDKILFVREKKEENYGKINFPGGHLEIGETPMEWAIRETKEETGLEIELEGFLTVYLGRNHPSFHYIFLGKVTGGELAKTNEVLESVWYSREELLAFPKDMFVYQEKVLDILQKYDSWDIFPITKIITDLKKI